MPSDRQPTEAEQRVLLELDKKNGNVKAVADELACTVSWVNRIKKAFWKQGEATALAEQQKEEKGLALVKSLLPPNIGAVGKLRDDTLADLNDSLPDLPAKTKVYLLNTLLRYETTLRQALAPSIQVLQDNRSVTINSLVDKLAGLDTSELKALAGVSDDVVEGEYTTCSKE